MAETALVAPSPPSPPVDRERFSTHPEAHMTERPSHRRQGTYTEYALRRVLPDWFVAGNMGVYWVPDQFEYPYVGPDVFVARNRPSRNDAATYFTYEDGPLTLVVEIASPATRKLDLQKRDRDYAVELAVPWHLWIDLLQPTLELCRLHEGRYVPVEPDKSGAVWCTDLGVGFAWQEDGRLVRVLAADGTTVPTDDEELILREEEAARRQLAEQRAEREARRAEQEATARQAAEERAEALAAELQRLRQAMEEGRDAPE
jgi:Uma2 family endonuclease